MSVLDQEQRCQMGIVSPNEIEFGASPPPLGWGCGGTCVPNSTDRHDHRRFPPGHPARFSFGCDGRSPDLRIMACPSLPGRHGAVQWHSSGSLTAHSCGGSHGFGALEAPPHRVPFSSCGYLRSARTIDSTLRKILSMFNSVVARTAFILCAHGRRRRQSCWMVRPAVFELRPGAASSTRSLLLSPKFHGVSVPHKCSSAWRMC